MLFIKLYFLSKEIDKNILKAIKNKKNSQYYRHAENFKYYWFFIAKLIL